MTRDRDREKQKLLKKSEATQLGENIACDYITDCHERGMHEAKINFFSIFVNKRI